jgi:ArsR family transcriptional regulator
MNQIYIYRFGFKIYVKFIFIDLQSLCKERKKFYIYWVIIINLERQEKIRKMLTCCKKSFEKLKNIGSELKAQVELKDLEIFFNALASKERIMIIKSLKDGDRCVCELETILDKSQSTISHHLRKLERAGLIYSFRKVNYTHYGLIKERLEGYVEIFNNEINTIINKLNIAF